MSRRRAADHRRAAAVGGGARLGRRRHLLQAPLARAVRRARARSTPGATTWKSSGASCSSSRAPGRPTPSSSASRAPSSTWRCRHRRRSRSSLHEGAQRTRHHAGLIPLAGASADRGAGRVCARARLARGQPAARRSQLPRQAGRRALLARAGDRRAPRHHHRPLRRAARGLDAGRLDLGQSQRAGARHRPDPAPRHGAQARPPGARAPHHQQSRPRVPVPRAPPPAGGSRADQGTRDSRGLHLARVPPLLPGGRGDRAPARLHQRRRRRPGRTGARVRSLAGRRGRRQARHPGPLRPHRAERREHPPGAPGPRSGAVDRPAHPVPRLPRAEGRDPRPARARRLRGRARRGHRRSARHGEPAGLQPQRPRPDRGRRPTATAPPPTSSSPARSIKPFFVAAGLASGKYDNRSIIDTSPGYFKVGVKIFEDEHNLGAIDIATVLAKSSNVGMAQIALSLPPQEIWTTLNAARLRPGDHQRLSRASRPACCRTTRSGGRSASPPCRTATACR